MSWESAARRAARKYGLPENYFTRQMGQEAHGQDLTSPAGAQGPAQIMPDTARGWGLSPSQVHQIDPAYDAAAKHMAEYVKQFGSFRNALVAYNAGPGRVGGSLPAETRNYISTIMRGPGGPQSAGAGQSPAPAIPPSPSAPTAPAVNPFNTIATLSTNQDSPFAAIMQRGWDLLGKIWEQKYGGQQASSPSLLNTAMGGDRAGGSISPSGDVGQYVKRANQLDKAHMPYLWGGGHGSNPVNPDKPTPVDCSGAVSAVLGVDPRVSGQFESWGRAGEGGKKGVTIYANDHHVLMKINGHFFGTSSTNPGGGAGWIPQSAISRDYLKNFTARHL
jgi:hypothetical protein